MNSTLSALFFEPWPGSLRIHCALAMNSHRTSGFSHYCLGDGWVSTARIDSCIIPLPLYIHSKGLHWEIWPYISIFTFHVFNKIVLSFTVSRGCRIQHWIIYCSIYRTDYQPDWKEITWSKKFCPKSYSTPGTTRSHVVIRKDIPLTNQ